MASLAKPNIVNFNFGERYLYGRIYRSQLPIKPHKSTLKNLTHVADAVTHLQAVNFVADAFNDMAQQFHKMSLSGKIDASDSFLSDIKAYKAYIDPEAAYDEYYASFRSSLKAVFGGKNIKFQGPRRRRPLRACAPVGR